MRRTVLAATSIFVLSIPLMVFGGASAEQPDGDAQSAAVGAGVVDEAGERSVAPRRVMSFVSPAEPWGTEPGTALVVIGSARYEFDVTELCVTRPTTHVLGLDEGGSTLLADFPAIGPAGHDDDGDPPSIVIHDSSGGSWVADADTGFEVAAGAVVHSFEVDGSTVTGTATFSRVRNAADIAPRLEIGTFSIACA